MVKSVLIVGGGSAGFITAIALKTHLPGLKLKVVRSKEIGVIGVGESTVPYLVAFLHHHLKLDPTYFYKCVDPVWKLGLRFLWGKQPWFDYTFGTQLARNYPGLSREAAFYVGSNFQDVGPQTALMSRNKAFMRTPDGKPDLSAPFAYHLENVRFVAWLEHHARNLGAEVIDGLVEHVAEGEEGVRDITLKDGQKFTADLYVDCTGFRSMLLGGLLKEPFVSYASTLFCNSAVTGGWDRAPGEDVQPYTTCETMDAGWCWQIDHAKVVNRGYVFSSDFMTDSQAEAEFRRKNPRVTNTHFIRFRSGRFERSWVKNVVAIGNSAGFVEPLESTAIAAFCIAVSFLTTAMEQCAASPTESWIKMFNQAFRRRWDGIRKFLAIHYRFNERLNTPFWRACREKVELAGAEPIVEFFQQNGPERHFQHYMLDKDDLFFASQRTRLSMLLGMGVPTKVTLTEASEWDKWDAVRASLGRAGDRAFGYDEAMAVFKSGAAMAGAYLQAMKSGTSVGRPAPAPPYNDDMEK